MSYQRSPNRMNLLLPREVRARLKAELRRAGDREIGGLLMAEQLAPGEFRIVDISVDHKAGTVVHFRRRAQRHAEKLHEFFEETGRTSRDITTWVSGIPTQVSRSTRAPRMLQQCGNSCVSLRLNSQRS